MQVGSAPNAQITQGQKTQGSGHPHGGPPGQMWKQALAEAGGEGGAWIPPGQRKKMQQEQPTQGQPVQGGAGAAPGGTAPGQQPAIGSGVGNIFQSAPQLA